MNPKKGSALIIILVYSGIFLMAIGAIVSLIIVEQKSVRYAVNSEDAFQITEAGLNQYRWELAHNPNNFTGTNQDYKDSNGDITGHYQVVVTPPTSGSTIITLTATGWTLAQPNQKRTIQARYGAPSYAQYAFLTNSNVWFGANESVHGRLHSNGGIRMDGTTDSLITTIKGTYICGPEHGCSNITKPGIWGSGANTNLWQFPVADTVDFNSVTLDLETMQTAASSGGVLLSPSGGFGYHIIFNNTGTFSVNKVTKLQTAVQASDGSTNFSVANDIKTETAVSGKQNLPLPANGIIFVQDQTWVTGSVKGRVTLAAAHLPDDGSTYYDIIIPSNITYYPDRTSGSTLGLIAQRNILVPLLSATNLEIDAALMAQKGHVFRYYYNPQTYPSDSVKNSIITYGTLITNTVWTWNWVDNSSKIISGYKTTSTNYDPSLLYAPPPFFPSKDQYTFISWNELYN